MKTLKKVEIEPVFVEGFIPEQLEQGKLYISGEFKTAIHLCLCGCGNQSVTPTGRNGWVLTEKDGKITLSPSILNHPCEAHYIIRNNVANFV